MSKCKNCDCNQITCQDIKKCETLTKLSIIDNVLSYKDEKGEVTEITLPLTSDTYITNISFDIENHTFSYTNSEGEIVEYDLTPILLQNNGVDNDSQTILNLVEGENITITDNGNGEILIESEAIVDEVMRFGVEDNAAIEDRWFDLGIYSFEITSFPEIDEDNDSGNEFLLNPTGLTNTVTNFLGDSTTIINQTNSQITLSAPEVFIEQIAEEVHPSVLYYDLSDGGVTYGPAPSGESAWLLEGNTGTTPGTNFLGTLDNQDFIIKRNNTQVGRFYSDHLYLNGNLGIQTASPTAHLHLPAGSTSASTACLKLTSGSQLSTPEAGALEWNGTNLFITQTSGPTRKTIAYTTDAAVSISASTILYSSGFGTTGTVGANSIVFGPNAGSGATGSSLCNIIGKDAGYQISNCGFCDFYGNGAGYQTTSADTSAFIGFYAGSAASGFIGTYCIGDLAGLQSNNAIYSVFLGSTAGTVSANSRDCTFVGGAAGNTAPNSQYSTFIGSNSGFNASSSTYSTFIGHRAGYQATGVTSGIFIGRDAGYQTINASYSILLGYKAGFKFTSNNIGTNNIIIGSNISLPDTTTNSINLGGVLFGSNTYATTTGNPSIAATATGSIAIGNVTPTARLDLPASTTSLASLRIRSGTAPTTPNDGDVWFDGTDIKIRVAGVTKTFTLV